MHKGFFQKIFFTSYKTTNKVTKMTFFVHRGISKKIFVVDVDMINETLGQIFHLAIAC
jgi:hypothetical protein